MTSDRGAARFGGALPSSSRPRSASVERITIQLMEHVGIVVDDLAAATAFFVAREVEEKWREKEG